MYVNFRPAIVFAAFLVMGAVSAGQAGAVQAAAQNTPTGIWMTQAGDAKVQVAPCGAALCGKVIWLKQPIDPATKRPQADDKNPNPALRDRPIIGIQLFIDMKPSGPNVWSGRIYNADDGQSYASTVTQTDAARLEVRGCVGALCGTEVWTRTTR